MTFQIKYYSDSYLKKIPVKDNCERFVNIKKHGNIITKRKVLVRETVAEMLKKAAKLLPKGHKFIIFDGYRDVKRQKFLFDRYFKKLKRKNLSWADLRIEKEASKYIANPNSICPHLTGGAIDISIAKCEKKTSICGAIDKNKKNTKEAKKNRELLKKIMEKAGFVSYPLEWWHWSYGDRYWAASKKRKFAIYKEIR